MKLPSQLGQKLKGLEHGTSCQAAMSISPKLPLLPNSPFSPNSPTFRGPSSWVNLFTLIIPGHISNFRKLNLVNCSVYGRVSPCL